MVESLQNILERAGALDAVRSVMLGQRVNDRVVWSATFDNPLHSQLLTAAVATYTSMYQRPLPSVVDRVYAMKCVMWLFIRNQVGASAQWIDAYDEVARWLCSNDGRGLFLLGNCGTGKTMIVRDVVVPIVRALYGKVIHFFNATDLNSNDASAHFNGDMREPLAWKMFKCVVIDDLGSEFVSDFRDLAMGVLTDEAEKNGKLLILTSNLSREELLERYGERVVDRLTALTHRVVFNGKSFRC